MTWPFTSALRGIIEALVSGDFEAVSARTRLSRLKAHDIRSVLERYGRTLTLPPEEEYASLDVVAVTGNVPPRYSVRVPLWTIEEGRSDLTLGLTISQGPCGYSVEVDDIHVL